jgi:hypothetical protein
MPNSTAAETFQVAVFRSLDAAARDALADRERLRQIEIIIARDSGARDASAIAPARIAALELAKIEPERMRTLEDKVTRLDVRSGMIGAGGGIVAAAVIEIAIRFFFAHHGAG